MEDENRVIERPQARLWYGLALARRATLAVHDCPKTSGVGFDSPLRKTKSGVDDLTSIVGQEFDIVKSG
jgi:hypothetical protein